MLTTVIGRNTSKQSWLLTVTCPVLITISPGQSPSSYNGAASVTFTTTFLEAAETTTATQQVEEYDTADDPADDDDPNFARRQPPKTRLAARRLAAARFWTGVVFHHAPVVQIPAAVGRAGFRRLVRVTPAVAAKYGGLWWPEIRIRLCTF